MPRPKVEAKVNVINISYLVVYSMMFGFRVKKINNLSLRLSHPISRICAACVILVKLYRFSYIGLIMSTNDGLVAV